MTQIEKIKAEIERRIADNKKDIERASHKHLEEYFEGYEDALALLKQQYLDTLEEEPVSNDLEEAAKEYSLIDSAEDINEYACYDIKMYNCFKAGAQWQKERILNNAIEREVKVDAGGYPYIDVTELYDYDKDKPLAKEGDKVKLIIIMEE